MSAAQIHRALQSLTLFGLLPACLQAAQLVSLSPAPSISQTHTQKHTYTFACGLHTWVLSRALSLSLSLFLSLSLLHTHWLADCTAGLCLSLFHTHKYTLACGLHSWSLSLSLLHTHIHNCVRAAQPASLYHPLALSLSRAYILVCLQHNCSPDFIQCHESHKLTYCHDSFALVTFFVLAFFHVCFLHGLHNGSLDSFLCCDLF